MGGKVVIVENGVAKTPIPLPKEIFHCAMYDDGTSCYESSGISEQEIEDAISAGKLVVCSFVTMHSGDILTTELIASSVLGPYPVFTGTCRTPSGLLAIKVTYDEENSTAQQEWWSVERTYIPSGNTITIDTELSETSTNPVQNKAINVLTRKLWDKVDIVSRLDNEYVRHDFYIVSQTNNKWGGSSTSNYKHWIVPVSNMREVIITSNANTQQAYSFFKSYSTPVPGDTPDYATGYSGIKGVSIGETLRVTVPPDAEYLYINTGNAGAAKAAHIYMTGIGITDEFELPSLDNNAGKVLAVNNSATGVEWVNQSSGGTAPKETIRVSCSTDAATRIKDVGISGYEPKDGDLISVYFSNDVGIGAQLRINSNIICNILSLGTAIDTGIIKAGDTATFSIDRSSSPGKAYLLSIDRASVVAATMPAIPDELNDLSDVELSNLSSTSDQVLAYTATGWRNIRLQNKRYGISFIRGNDGYTFSSINMMSSLTDTSFAVTVHELSNKILTACPIDVLLTITNSGSGIKVVLYPSEEKYDNDSPYTSDHVCFCGFYYSNTNPVIYRVKGDNSTGSDVWTLEEIQIPVNPVTIYSGSSVPASDLGSNGDIYIQTQS